MITNPIASRRGVVQEGARRLKPLGDPCAMREAEWLLGRLIGVKALDIYLDEALLPRETIERFFSQIQARAAGAPLQYLIGEADFFGRRFTMAPGVFIRRPGTEAIVERAIEALRAREAALGRPLRLLDAGTGSGCIAVTLACALPACVVVGVELLWSALFVAQRNVLRHGVSERVRLIQGDWLEAIRGEFDGLVSNPPYVPSNAVERLPPDVRQEPRASLDGGEDGLRDIRRILAQAPMRVRSGGLIMLECGEDQVARLMNDAAVAPWVHRAEALHDLAGRPRGILIERTADLLSRHELSNY